MKDDLSMDLLQMPRSVRKIIDEWIARCDVVNRGFFDAECAVFFEELKHDWIVRSASGVPRTTLVVPKNAPNWLEVEGGWGHFTDDHNGVTGEYEIRVERCPNPTLEAARTLQKYVWVDTELDRLMRALSEKEAFEALKRAPINLDICPIARPLRFIREAISQEIDLKLLRPGNRGGYSTQEELERDNSDKTGTATEMRLPERVRKIVLEEWIPSADLDEEARQCFIFDEENQILFYSEEKHQYDFRRQLFVSDEKYEWIARCMAEDPAEEGVYLVIPKNGKNWFEVSEHSWGGDFGISGQYEFEIERCPNPTFEITVMIKQRVLGSSLDEIFEALKNTPANLGVVIVQSPLKLIKEVFPYGVYLKLSRPEDRGRYSTADEFGY